MAADDIHNSSLRRVVAIVAALNFAYFGIEFAVALASRRSVNSPQDGIVSGGS